MKYDPKLKEAMEEIRSVLKKYDIAGAVTLASPTHSEYMNEISPSWSCARIETTPEGKKSVRFKATIAEYGSKESRDAAALATVHMLLQIRDIGGQTYQMFDAIAEQLEGQMIITHKPFHTGEPTP